MSSMGGNSDGANFDPLRLDNAREPIYVLNYNVMNNLIPVFGVIIERRNNFKVAFIKHVMITE